MKSLEDVRRQLSHGFFELTRHAFKRAVERNVSDREIREAGRVAEVIESYPDDKYSPSCLLLGFTSELRPMHLQVSLAMSDMVKLITLYEPDVADWIDYRVRR